jgi:hypothetical protein
LVMFSVAVHLKMAKMVNLTSGIFYHNLKKDSHKCSGKRGKWPDAGLS